MTEILTKEEIDKLLKAIKDGEVKDFENENSDWNDGDNLEPDEKGIFLELSHYLPLADNDIDLINLLTALCKVIHTNKISADKYIQSIRETGSLSVREVKKLHSNIIQKNDRFINKQNQDILLGALLKTFHDVDVLSGAEVTALYSALGNPPSKKTIRLIDFYPPRIIPHQRLNNFEMEMRTILKEFLNQFDEKLTFSFSIEQLLFNEFRRSLPEQGFILVGKHTKTKSKVYLELDEKFFKILNREKITKKKVSALASEEREILFSKTKTFLNNILSKYNSVYEVDFFTQISSLRENNSQDNEQFLYIVTNVEQNKVDLYLNLAFPIRAFIDSAKLQKGKRLIEESRAVSIANSILKLRIDDSTETVKIKKIPKAGWIIYWEAHETKKFHRRNQCPPFFVDRWGRISKTTGIRARFKQEIKHFETGHRKTINLISNPDHRIKINLRPILES